MHKRRYHNSPKNCGCGSTLSTNSSGVTSCPNNCEMAPIIEFSCANGLECGGTFDINVFEELNRELPEGYVIEPISWDTDFYQQVTISPEGDISGQAKPGYTERKGRILFRMCKTDGSPESSTGWVTYCIKNECGEIPCDGQCNPCTGEYICAEGSEVDGSSGVAASTTQSNMEGPYLYHNVFVEGPSQPQQDLSLIHI